jgi:hypothetical protein
MLSAVMLCVSPEAKNSAKPQSYSQLIDHKENICLASIIKLKYSVCASLVIVLDTCLTYHPYL